MKVDGTPLQVGAVIFPGFELLDIYGPLEMFGLLRDRVSITMLAENSGEVRSSQGPRGVADLALADASAFDVLLVPGGWGTRAEVRNLPFLDMLRARAGEARFVASICTGSALLAKAGVLDGKKATSNKLAFDWVTTQGPDVEWIKEARWVEDGRFFTSSGVSAGMDMTLGLIQHIFGREVSLQVARWAEYTWHEDKSVDPFASSILENKEHE
jgi:transcriptional regulator GlxA family with amidase domain